MMANVMTTRKPAYRPLGVLLMIAGLWPALAPAQEVETQPTSPRRHARGPTSRQGMEGLFRGLFRAAPEDQGPLRPGEADELLAFAARHTPRLFRPLDELRQRDQHRFALKMAEHAPRLRHLRRIYERSPEMGALVQAYAGELVAIERKISSLRELRASATDSAEYVAALEDVRIRVAQNVDRECDALELMANHLEAEREDRIAGRVAYLTGGDTLQVPETEALTALVSAFEECATDAEREAVRQKMRAEITRELQAEIAGLRIRAERLRAEKFDEVERRLRHLLEPPARRGGRRGGPPAQGPDCRPAPPGDLGTPPSGGW
jgi:hypothetical protein